MIDTYRNPTDPREYSPRTSDSTDPVATVPADRRRAIAARSWLLSAPEPTVTPSTIPGAYRGGR